MQKQIIKSQLSDHSSCFDLLITTFSGNFIATFHCRDEKSANALSKALESFTVDFSTEPTKARLSRVVCDACGRPKSACVNHDCLHEKHLRPELRPM